MPRPIDQTAGIGQLFRKAQIDINIANQAFDRIKIDARQIQSGNRNIVPIMSRAGV